ncbi:MAG: hypothetical protein AB7O62_02365 [Pirellulales bacterium]
MTLNQEEFNRAVARATGESVDTITQRGFVLLTASPFEREPRAGDYEEFLTKNPAAELPPGTNYATA